jgi:hypothetical protein
MGFIQIIELKTHDIDAVRELQDRYRQSTAGKNTIQGKILTRDRNDPRRYFNIVFFESYESAMRNSHLPETQADLGNFKPVLDVPPVFYDLDVLDDRR